MAKFCIKCGKPLVNGQVCECRRSAVNISSEPWKNPEVFYSSHSTDKPEKESLSEIKPTAGFNKETAMGLWKAFKVKIGVEDPEVNDKNVYERNMQIVPECISPDEGEIPVRQYTVAKLRTLYKFHWAEGRLQVTNKRVIFRAPGRSLLSKTILQHEFAIDEIAGVEARKEPRFSFFDWCIAFLCAYIFASTTGKILRFIYDIIPLLGSFMSIAAFIGGIVPMFTMHKKFLLKVALIGISAGAVVFMNNDAESINWLGAILKWPFVILWFICSLLYCIKTNLVLTIKTKGASGAVEIRRKKRKGLLGLIYPNSASEKEEYTGFSNVFPMQDTEKSIREIGAVISDIQKLGDYGVEKWKK